MRSDSFTELRKGAVAPVSTARWRIQLRLHGDVPKGKGEITGEMWAGRRGRRRHFLQPKYSIGQKRVCAKGVYLLSHFFLFLHINCLIKTDIFLFHLIHIIPLIGWLPAWKCSIFIYIRAAHMGLCRLISSGTTRQMTRSRFAVIFFWGGGNICKCMFYRRAC